jgi:TusA-related sulfurtransferase
VDDEARQSVEDQYGTIHDYYNERGYLEDYAYSSHCCLSCERASPGCLCYDCRCIKCEHYHATNSEKGYCTLARREGGGEEGRVLIELVNRKEGQILFVSLDGRLSKEDFKQVSEFMWHFCFLYDEENKEWTHLCSKDNYGWLFSWLVERLNEWQIEHDEKNCEGLK